MTLFEELKWRGLIKDVAGEDLEKLLNGKPITFYWGTDYLTYHSQYHV